MRTSATPEGLWSGAPQSEGPAAPRYPLFVSEYGQCGAVDLVRTIRHYEQLGKEQADDARYYRRQMDKFLADWKLWDLDRIWPRTDDFFTASHANLVRLRRTGENALRANPHVVAFSSTAPIVEAGFCGSGVANAFRELKPGLADATFELSAPLRWCLFAEPTSVYRGARVKLEAVLANEDVLRPGKYPVRLQVVGPNGAQVWEKTVQAEVPNRGENQEPPFALPVFAEEMAVDGPPGRYRFLATILDGGAPQGGQTEFFVDAAETMPQIAAEVVLWGDDPQLRQWLSSSRIAAKPFVSGLQAARQLILASGKPEAPGGASAFAELAKHTARGSAVVFLDPGMFGDGQNAVRWVPLAKKGFLGPIDWVGGYYRAEVWAKAHPVFDGLPAGGLLDPLFYREILPPRVFLRCHTVGRGFVEEEVTTELDAPEEAICGANRLSANYASGLHVAVYRFGEGRFLLNTLSIRENLGRVPAAERLLRNMLRHMGRETDRPPTDLPADFGSTLKAMGYQP
jgi:hypothetical protein